MNNILKYLNIILDQKEKRRFLLVLGGTFFVGLLETISIGSLVGYLLIISEPEILLSKIEIKFIHSVLSNLDYKDLIIYSSITLVLIFIFKNIIQIFFHYMEINFIKTIQIKFTKSIFQIFLLKPYIFHVNQNSSISINTILNETKRASDYIYNILMISREVIILIFLIILMMIVNIKLSFFLSLMMIFFSIIFYISISKSIKNLGSKVRVKSEKILKNLTESILSIKIIKLINKNNYFVKILTKEMYEKKKIEVMYNMIGRIPKFFLEILSVIVVIFILLFFVYQDKSIEDAIPTLSLIVLIIIRTMPAYVSINTNLNNTKYNSVAFSNTCSAILHNNNQDMIDIKEINTDHKTEIKVSNISFAYKDKMILKNISKEFNTGKIFAIKGVSGSGKTTLLNLILGLLTPTKGEIFINDKKLHNNIVSTYDLFSYVPQDIYLLDCSIAENIAIGIEEKDIDYDLINTITKDLNLKDFINELPDGLKTPVGDKGVKISGGQRQRIGIARALYSNPKIIIFDEATNAMDSNLEDKILDYFNKLKEKKIIILVTHNNKILNKCDEIIEVLDGEIN
jgi:ATP-binding cassette subfamily B protein